MKYFSLGGLYAASLWLAYLCGHAFSTAESQLSSIIMLAEIVGSMPAVLALAVFAGLIFLSLSGRSLRKNIREAETFWRPPSNPNEEGQSVLQQQWNADGKGNSPHVFTSCGEVGECFICGKHMRDDIHNVSIADNP